MLLNPYKIKWALFINEKNELDFKKSIHAPNQKSLEEKLVGQKGRFFIITDKQFGYIQNSWSKDKQLEANTPLSVHFLVKNKHGMESLIPQLKFEIETIRTTKYDKNIDRYECAADFKMIGNANTTTLPITYTVESTDKKGEFYVTVDGF